MLVLLLYQYINNASILLMYRNQIINALMSLMHRKLALAQGF